MEGQPFSKTAPASNAPWQRVEILRLDDSFVCLLNGKVVSVVTNLRNTRNNGNERQTGASNFIVWADSSPAWFRNMEIREINGWPAEVRTQAYP